MVFVELNRARSPTLITPNFDSQTSHEGTALFYSCPPKICWYYIYTLVW